MENEKLNNVFNALSDHINNMSEDGTALAQKMATDHPTLQQKYYTFVCKFIKEMAEKKYTDPRNRFAHDMCVKLYDVLKAEGCGEDGCGAPFI